MYYSREYGTTIGLCHVGIIMYYSREYGTTIIHHTYFLSMVRTFMGRGAVEKGGNAPWATDLSTVIKILRKLPLLLVYVYCQEVVPY